jgi:hypothetical protein
MKAKLSAHLQAIVDSICGQGCQQVRQIIQQLQQGGAVEKTQSLSAKERNVLLAELQSIMAVYKRSQ